MTTKTEYVTPSKLKVEPIVEATEKKNTNSLSPLMLLGAALGGLGLLSSLLESEPLLEDTTTKKPFEVKVEVASSDYSIVSMTIEDQDIPAFYLFTNSNHTFALGHIHNESISVFNEMVHALESHLAKYEVKLESDALYELTKEMLNQLPKEVTEWILSPPNYITVHKSIHLPEQLKDTKGTAFTLVLDSKFLANIGLDFICIDQVNPHTFDIKVLINNEVHSFSLYGDLETEIRLFLSQRMYEIWKPQLRFSLEDTLKWAKDIAGQIKKGWDKEQRKIQEATFINAAKQYLADGKPIKTDTFYIEKIGFRDVFTFSKDRNIYALEVDQITDTLMWSYWAGPHTSIYKGDHYIDLLKIIDKDFSTMVRAKQTEEEARSIINLMAQLTSVILSNSRKLNASKQTVNKMSENSILQFKEAAKEYLDKGKNTTTTEFSVYRLGPEDVFTFRIGKDAYSLGTCREKDKCLYTLYTPSGKLSFYDHRYKEILPSFHTLTKNRVNEEERIHVATIYSDLVMLIEKSIRTSKAEQDANLFWDNIEKAIERFKVTGLAQVYKEISIASDPYCDVYQIQLPIGSMVIKTSGKSTGKLGYSAYLDNRCLLFHSSLENAKSILEYELQNQYNYSDSLANTMAATPLKAINLIDTYHKQKVLSLSQKIGEA